MYQEYKLEIVDPYWKKQYDALVASGIPKSIARSALIKADIERSTKVMYQ